MELKPGSKKKKLLERLKRRAEALLGAAKGSHDAEHTMRVAALALHIAKKERADIFQVLSAAYMHDIARSAEDKSGGRIDHAVKGADMALGILLKSGVSEKEAHVISDAIRSHRFRGKHKPMTKAAKCLFDADKLDSIGAVGIGRAFLFAGEVGARLHNPGVNIKDTRPYTKEDTAYREFMVKLRYVKSRMQTAEGRRLAKKRHDFMVEFFRELDREVKGAL